MYIVLSCYVYCTNLDEAAGLVLHRYVEAQQREEGVIVLLHEALAGPRRLFFVSTDPIGDPTEPYRNIPIRPYPTGKKPDPTQSEPTLPDRTQPDPTQPDQART